MKQRPLVLVVEDDPHIALGLRETLRSERYEVHRVRQRRRRPARSSSAAAPTSSCST